MSRRRLSDDILTPIMNRATHAAVHAATLPKPAGPYSPGMAFERLVFVSGQRGTDPAAGQRAGDDIERQTEQCLKNVQTILEASGSSLQHVLRCGVFRSEENTSEPQS